MRRCSVVFIALLFAASLAGCVTSATSGAATAAYSENAATSSDTTIFSGSSEAADSLFYIASTPTPEASPTDMPFGSTGLATSTAASVTSALTATVTTATPTVTPTVMPSFTPNSTGTPAPATPAPTATPEFSVHDLEDVKGYVSAGTVNMRKGPGTGYELMAEYERGDTLYITAESGDWYRVKIDGTRGYMLKEYVSEGSVPTATPKPTVKPTPAATEQPEPTPEASISTGSSSYTSDELYLLAQLVYKEGDGPSYYAVACVIDNRIKSSKFPNTVHGVVYQSGQFSTSGFKKPSSAAISAVSMVFVDGNNSLPSGVLYFRNSSGWSGHEAYEKIGGNYFYY